MEQVKLLLHLQEILVLVAVVEQLLQVELEVTLHLGHPASAFERLERILDQFEQFCTVSQSVAAALPIQLTVLDSDGVKLKG